LLELSPFALRTADRVRYRQGAEHILQSLTSREYMAVGPHHDGILLHATGHKPANREIDVSLIYGDYYFLEALGRL
jgi:unsaturated chondroitin disaccharide hydrolase